MQRALSEGDDKVHRDILREISHCAGADLLACFCVVRVSCTVARPWKYDPAQSEYFVESSTRQTIRTTEIRKQQEIQETTVPWVYLQLSDATS